MLGMYEKTVDEDPGDDRILSLLLSQFGHPRAPRNGDNSGAFESLHALFELGDDGIVDGAVKKACDLEELPDTLFSVRGTGWA